MVAGALNVEPMDAPVFGPYRIQGLLGRGGMGVVHRAYDTVHDRVIALKRLPQSVTDRDYRARFKREARLAAALSHPNVIPVNDFGEVDGDLFIDMMLVEGTDLRRAMGAGTLDPDRALHILTQVAAALDAAHREGLVHRDVKPSNILIDEHDHAYLADFGIARETSPEATALTGSGDLIGTWDYMAPERLSAGPVDGRSDQYSLACVLFECLTGRAAHPASDPAAKIAAHLLQPPPAPSVFVPAITRELDTVVMRGMAKDPARRFATATELITTAKAAAYAGNTAKAAPATEDQAKLVKAILRSSAPRLTPTKPITATAPYPGLAGFEEQDAELFHGRTHVVTDLLVRMAEQLDGGEPVVLVGASGAGKSSVLHAGLLPRLTDWPHVVIAPGPDPIGALATAIAPHVGGDPAGLAARIRQQPDEFGALYGHDAAGNRMVIVIDQFEELFTHGVPDTDRRAFATALAHARPALAVLAVRADLVDRCIELSPLIPALTAPVLLGAMDATELRQAIVRPARDFGVDIEPGLPERLIADLGVRGETGYDPGALPRMAHALREAWNFREGSVVTLAAYRKAGGIDGAVSRTAEDIYARLDPAGREALRSVMLRLVTVSDEGTVTRRRVQQHEISGHILDGLIKSRLVTVDATGARLSHEALLTAWPRLRDWIDEDRAGLIQHRRFTDAVRVWSESGQQDDDLYRGARLATVNAWLEQGRTELRPSEQEFLDRSNAAEHAGQIAARRRTRRLRTMVAALSVLLLVATGAVVVATQLQRDASNERDRADSGRQLNLSRQLAAESELARGIDHARTGLLALGAWQAGQTVESRSALLGVRADHYRGRMLGHDGPISGLAMTVDGKLAASGGRDGSLRLWDVPSRRELAVLHDGDGWYRSVSLSDDGRLLLAADVLGTKVTLWNAPERKEIFTVPGRSLDGRIAPDGKTFVAYTEQGMTVWDTAKLTQTTRFATAGSLVMSYSPDGRFVVSTNEKNVDVRRASDGTVVATLTGHTDPVAAMAFDRAGTMLATVSPDRHLKLWDTEKWTQKLDREISEPGLTAVTFNSTGTSVLAGGVGTSIYVWDVASGEHMLGLGTGAVTTFALAMSGDGHTFLSADSAGQITVWAFQRTVLGPRDGALVGVASQPNGNLIATVTGDGAIRLWDGTNGDLVRQFTHGGKAGALTFTPDGTRLITVGPDGAAVAFDVATGAERLRFGRPGTEFTDVVVSPDGRTVALAGRTPAQKGAQQQDRDEIVFLRADDLTMTSRRPTRQEPRNDSVVDANYPTSVVYSPDGRTLATTLSGGRVGLLSLADPTGPMKILPGHTGLAMDARFTPDGNTLATGGSDRLVRLWRVPDGQPVGELGGHDSPIRAIRFSPDGRTMATASQDAVARLWEYPSGRPLARLDRHDDDLNDATFDTTGTRVLSASADGTARIWDLDTGAAVREVCGRLDRATLADQWAAIGSDRGSVPTCPS
ncbi:WD40 repeat domain-containing serine/threonine protein kinase [Kibdelosporangium persicum]|uniref:Serine/threonine protein kinase n=1 Tax=Kibdelosporangium persicum TaxID=2698649 RepID=A0ABX2F6Z3_9PSEU|nr:serine/threonine-protein kinase [Kibdelosporangium persicum]NRN67116.1 Serine/threonine protein kinase [Kibdelosporangium persicum]